MSESNWEIYKKQTSKGGGGPKITTPAINIQKHLPDSYNKPQYAINILQTLYEQMGEPDRVTFAIEDRTIGMRPGGDSAVAYSLNTRGTNARVSCTALFNTFDFEPRTGRYVVERDRGYWAFELEVEE